MVKSGGTKLRWIWSKCIWFLKMWPESLLWPAPHSCWSQKLFVSLHGVLSKERFHSLNVGWQVNSRKGEWQADYRRAQNKILYGLGEQDSSGHILTSQTCGFAHHYMPTLWEKQEKVLSILQWTANAMRYNTQCILPNKHAYSQ